MKKQTTLFLLLAFTFSFCKNEKPKTDDQKSKEELTVSPEIADPFISPTDAFIKKYTGKIGEEKEIQLVLINWSNGNLGGYFQYLEKKGAGKKLDLVGELHLNEDFILDIFSEDDYMGSFHGSLSELETIEGTWQNQDSTVVEQLSLKEIPMKDTSGWTGDWFRNDLYSPGTLIIGNVTDKQFDFGLEVFNGAHTGLLEGTAVLTNRIGTYKSYIFDEEEACFLIFQKKEKQIIVIQKSSPGACGFGMRAYADGKFDDILLENNPQLSFGTSESIFESKEQHDIFKTLVGEYYNLFATNMQTIRTVEIDPKEDFEATVSVGGVPGLFTLNEAIILQNNKGQFWAAVIDLDDLTDENYLRYFTNDATRKEKLPYTIEAWRERFKEYRIIF